VNDVNMWCVDPGPPWIAITGGLEESEFPRWFLTILYHVLQSFPAVGQAKSASPSKVIYVSVDGILWNNDETWPDT